jgi:hypothetical protein
LEDIFSADTDDQIWWRAGAYQPLFIASL